MLRTLRDNLKEEVFVLKEARFAMWMGLMLRYTDTPVSAYRILWAAYPEFERDGCFAMKELAAKLGVSKQNVHQITAPLRKTGVIQSDGKKWHLNYKFFSQLEEDFKNGVR